MIYSTFYADGHIDATSGAAPSPPTPRRFNGNETNVYAMEYLAGYAYGKADIAKYFNLRRAGMAPVQAFKQALGE